QIAAVVMARMNLINSKKDELTIAMKGLTDLTQELVQAYATQMQVIEQLATRLKAVEEQAGANGVNGPAVAPGMPSAGERDTVSHDSVGACIAVMSTTMSVYCIIKI